MLRLNSAMALAVLSAAFGLAQPALAQKAKDTLRVPYRQPVQTVDAYYGSGGEANSAVRVVFDTLVNYDTDKNEYVGAIASSWKQVDPLTMEFKIRSDVKFTDGQPMTMDDILYTFQFMADPTAKYRFQDTRSDWLGGVEKMDDWTIRVRGREQMAVMLGKLTQVPYVLPKHIHAKLEKREFFGQKPVGTGPYKVLEVDDVSGVLLKRNADYKHINTGKPAGLIENIRITPVPDMQTQTARMLRGEQDMMYGVDPDLAQSFVGNLEFAVRAEDSVSFNFLQFDAKALSGNKLFTDKRVRQAVTHAIDRDELRKLLPPEIAKIPALETVCSPLIKYCASSVKLPEYDPAKAKRLLAEAGYPDGFDLPILTWGAGKEAAEGIAGMLRKVGIRASVETAAFGVFVKKRIDGVVAVVTVWDNSVGQPDINNTAEFYFMTNSRSYANDPDLNKMVLEGRAELDPVKRAAIYKDMFNKANEEVYVVPLKRVPAVLVHRKDINLLSGHKDPLGFEFNRIAWN